MGYIAAGSGGVWWRPRNVYPKYEDSVQIRGEQQILQAFTPFQSLKTLQPLHMIQPVEPVQPAEPVESVESFEMVEV